MPFLPPRAAQCRPLRHVLLPCGARSSLMPRPSPRLPWQCPCVVSHAAPLRPRAQRPPLSAHAPPGAPCQVSDGCSTTP
eukprot:14117565-Alexandrium_andersonii.AAC.1